MLFACTSTICLPVLTLSGAPTVLLQLSLARATRECAQSQVKPRSGFRTATLAITVVTTLVTVVDGHRTAAKTLSASSHGPTWCCAHVIRTTAPGPHHIAHHHPRRSECSASHLWVGLRVRYAI